MAEAISKTTYSESGNKFVANLGTNPLGAFNFFLRVEGIMDLPCRAVRAFQRENEFEYIQEGGLNDYVHLRRKPISKPFTFQVERYVTSDMIYDPLALGVELVLPLLLMVNKYPWTGYPCPIRTYTFTGCTVIAKEYGELNAEKGSLLVETSTIAYREMICTDLEFDFYSKDSWKFDGTLAGQGTAHKKEGTEINNKATPTPWDFEGKNVEGNGKRHLTTAAISYKNDEEARKEEQEKSTEPKIDHTPWDFDGEKVEGNGKRHLTKAAISYKDASTKATGTKWSIKDVDGNRHPFNPFGEVSEEEKENPEGADAGAEETSNTVGAWDFDGNNVAGNGKRHLTQKDVSTKATGTKWSIKNVDENRHQFNPFGEVSEEEKENPEGADEEAGGTANAWDFDGDKKEGNGKLHPYGKDLSTTKEAKKWKMSKDLKDFRGSDGSAAKSDSKSAKGRKWPQQRSAREVAQFLSKNKK